MRQVVSLVTPSWSCTPGVPEPQCATLS